MLRLLGLLTLAGAVSACAARADVAPPEPARADGAPLASAAEPLERSIRAHMQFLASDALNGRGSGTRDEWIAATYLGAQLARLGLEPMGDDGGFVQQIEIQRFTTTGPTTLVIGERTLTHGVEMLVRAVAVAGASGPLHRYVPGTAVPAGSVVVLPGTVPTDAYAAVSRAALVLQRETPAIRERWPAMAKAPAAVSPQLVNVPAGGPAAPSWITLDAASHDAAMSAAEGTVVTLHATVTPAARTRTWNAVGRLVGRDPAGASDAIVLSAHLDHVGAREASPDNPGADVIFNGADDDASGVVAVLELAHALVEGPRPRRTVVVAFFGSEEAGGFGSRYFVNRPVVPLTDIAANLQFEMIGRPDPKVPPGTLWLTGYERSTLGPSLAAHGARLVQDPHPEQRFFERSDNIQFARRGVVAHTVSSYGLHQEYHQPSDELGHINIAHMRDAIRSLVEPVRRLADSLERPSWNEGMRP